MGFAIVDPDRFERFVTVGRRERSISTWPSPPAPTDDAPEGAWLLLGFMELAEDQVAMYGLLSKDLRQREGWADRVGDIVAGALAVHEEKAMTKAQIREVLESILEEIV